MLPRLWWVIEELVPDGLWERIAPLLPPPKSRRHRYPGRRPIDDRAALAGIVFVLKTGITWNQLPTSLVGCSGVTCWRRLRNWTGAGVWPALHAQPLDQLRALGELDLSDRRGVINPEDLSKILDTAQGQRQPLEALAIPIEIEPVSSGAAGGVELGDGGAEPGVPWWAAMGDLRRPKGGF